MSKCKCYEECVEKIPLYDEFSGKVSRYVDRKIGRCAGTREKDYCHCMGIESECDFYEHVKERGRRRQTRTTIPEGDVISIIEFDMFELRSQQALIYRENMEIPEPRDGYVWVGIQGDWRYMSVEQITKNCLESVKLWVEMQLEAYNKRND